MNHAVVSEHLADYLEGDLELDLRALVDAHLDVCEDCAQEVLEMQQTIRLLRALPEPEVPPMIAADVMRRIRAGETRPSMLERIQRVVGGVLEPSFVLPAAAVAVAGLAVVLVERSGSLGDVLEWVGAGQEPTVVAREAGILDDALALAETSGERSFGASVARETSRAGEVVAPPATRAPRASESLAQAHASRSNGTVTSGAGSTGAGRSSVPFASDDDGVERLVQADRPGHVDATLPTWNASTWPRVQPGRSSGRGRPGDGLLAQGFASQVSGPATALSNRVPGELATVSIPNRSSGARRGFVVEHSGGEDPRDVWLARALGQPADFARFIARHNLAEQELWVARLSERARSRGLLDELVEVLRGSGDETAVWLAEDFAAERRASAVDDGADAIDEGAAVERADGGLDR